MSENKILWYLPQMTKPLKRATMLCKEGNWNEKREYNGESH